MTYSSGTTSSAGFNVGSIIPEAFGVLNGAFLRFATLAVIPVIPPFISIFVVGAPTINNQRNFTATSWILTAISAILFFAIQGAMAYGAFNEVRGRRFSIGDALSKGLVRSLPLLGVAILSWVAIALGLYC